MMARNTESVRETILGPWGAAVLALAFTLRVAYALSTAETTSFDEDAYLDLGINLLEGRGWSHAKGAYSTALPGQPTSFFEPLYPVLLAGTLAIVGRDDLRWARALQAVLTTASVALLMQLAAQLWDRRVALVVGFVAAVYVPFVFFNALLMTENLFIFLFLLFLLLWTRAAGSASPARLVAAGVIYGATCLTRSAFAGFLPIVCTLTALAWRSQTRRGIGAAALFLAAVLLTIAPWTVRNYLVHHALVPITTKGGYNLYFYTYPSANLDFNERHADVPRPSLDGLTEVERDQTFSAAALDNIRSTPARQLHFAVVKLFDFFNPVAKRSPWIVRYTHAGMFLGIFVLALLGLRAAQPRVPATFHLLWILVAYYTLLAAIFTGGGKARLQIEPALLLLAGGGLTSLRHASPSPTRKSV